MYRRYAANRSSRCFRKDLDMPRAIERTVLPIPDRTHVGLTTYDAKDPDTSFPPIEPLRPPEGRRTFWSS
jgi:hypothetical protein